MSHFTLPAATAIQQVTLRTRRLAELKIFYQTVLGLQEIARTANQVHLAAGEPTSAQLILEEDKAAPLFNRRQPGLYHVAWLVPNRQELALALRHLIQTKWPLQGFGDHLVSEAIYLSDPDGNGIEVYADRPRNTWPMVNGQVQMDTLAVDVPNLLAELQNAYVAWSGLPAGTVIGHIHLQVSSLAAAKQFYSGQLGFNVMQQNYPGALFISAGGYHHHLGLNTWHSLSTAPGPQGQTGLANFTIRVPDHEIFNQLKTNLKAAGLATETLNHDLFAVQDPNNLQIFIQA